jgi:hypothetical protein
VYNVFTHYLPLALSLTLSETATLSFPICLSLLSFPFASACIASSSSLSVACPCCFHFVSRLLSYCFDSACSYNSSPSSSSCTMYSPINYHLLFLFRRLRRYRFLFVCRFLSLSFACIAVSSSLYIARPRCFLFLYVHRLLTFSFARSYSSSPISSSSSMHSSSDSRLLSATAPLSLPVCLLLALFLFRYRSYSSMYSPSEFRLLFLVLYRRLPTVARSLSRFHFQMNGGFKAGFRTRFQLNVDFGAWF